MLNIEYLLFCNYNVPMWCENCYLTVSVVENVMVFNLMNNMTLYILVFSKCFCAGYFTFSQLKFKVNKGINL